MAGGTTQNSIVVAVPKISNIQLNDLFWTLQGEGQMAGRRMLFVRFPFCNYDCPWCDTEYNTFKTWSLDEFRDFANQEKSRWAVLTGGEPMVHKHLPVVIETLKDLGFQIACETNGSAPIPLEIDFPTVSPKSYTKGTQPKYFIHPEALERAKEFKYVVDDQFDFSILERHKPYSKEITYSLSPEFNQMNEMVHKRILPFISENPHWKLNLQTHKWIDIP